MEQRAPTRVATGRTPRRTPRRTPPFSIMGDRWIFSIFICSAIISFVSVLIVLSSLFIKSGAGGFQPSIENNFESVARLDYLSYSLSIAGSCLLVVVSLSMTCIFGKFSIGTTRTTRITRIGVTAVAPPMSMWGDSGQSNHGAADLMTTIGAGSSSAAVLGGQAHALVRLLTSIDTRQDPMLHKTVIKACYILRSTPHLWDSDRSTIERKMAKNDEGEGKNSAASDTQTGVWLANILSATPDWLQDDEEDGEFNDDGIDTSSSTTTTTASSEETISNGRRRSTLSSFRGKVHRMVIAKRLQGSIVQESQEDQALIKMMDSIFSWKFDIFKFDEKTGNKSLVFLTLEAVRRLRLPLDIRPKSKEFNMFLTDIQAGYMNNPYHNRLHAADVVQTCGHFLSRPIIKTCLKQ